MTAPTTDSRLPGSVRWLRVLLFAMAGLWFAMAVGTFAMLGADAYALGYLLVESVPGAVFLLLGLFLRKSGRVIFGAVLAVMAVYLVTVLVSVIGEGAFTQLALPVAALVLLLRRSSRAFFLGR